MTVWKSAPIGVLLLLLAACNDRAREPEPPAGSFSTDSASIAVDSQDSVKVAVALVTPAFFEALNTHPLLGRLFVAGDYQQNSTRPVLLAWSLWQAHFHARPTIIGTTVTVRGRPAMVVGIMPKGFEQPDHTSLWLPARDSTTVRGSS